MTENLRKIGGISIIFAFVSFTLAKFLPWEAGYGIGLLFVVVGLIIFANMQYRAKPSDIPGPGGAEYQAAVKQAIGFDLKSFPFLILTLVGMYFAGVVLNSEILFVVFVIAMLGVLFYSRWLTLKIGYRGAQYVTKQNTVIKVKTVLIVVLAIIGGLTFWYFVGRNIPQQLNGSNKSAASSNVSTNEELGWKTYHNDEYGFSFQYPTSLGDLFTLADKSLAIGHEGGANVVIYMPRVLLHNGKPITVSDWANDCGDKSCTTSTVKVGGIQSFEVSSSQDGDTISVPLSNNQILQIQGSLDNPMFVQMLSTFKFTK